MKSKLKLFIEGRNESYDWKYVDETMTVGELIEYLNQYEDDTPVYLKNDGGYTYGSVTETSFEECDDD